MFSGWVKELINLNMVKIQKVPYEDLEISFRIYYISILNQFDALKVQQLH